MVFRHMRLKLISLPPSLCLLYLSSRVLSSISFYLPFPYLSVSLLLSVTCCLSLSLSLSLAVSPSVSYCLSLFSLSPPSHFSLHFLLSNSLFLFAVTLQAIFPHSTT